MSEVNLYRELANELREKSINAYMQAEDQMVVSRQRGAPWPNAGNSFWVSHKDSVWYVATWSPRCYRVPAEMDLIGLIERFVDYGDRAQHAVPVELVNDYGLTELSLEESDELFGFNSPSELSVELTTVLPPPTSHCLNPQQCILD